MMSQTTQRHATQRSARAGKESRSGIMANGSWLMASGSGRQARLAQHTQSDWGGMDNARVQGAKHTTANMHN